MLSETMDLKWESRIPTIDISAVDGKTIKTVVIRNSEEYFTFLFTDGTILEIGGELNGDDVELYSQNLWLRDLSCDEAEELEICTSQQHRQLNDAYHKEMHEKRISESEQAERDLYERLKAKFESDV